MLCELQVQGVAKFVANRNLPPALKEDISRHLEGSQLIRNEQGEEDVFSRLSHTLQVCHPLSAPSHWPLSSMKPYPASSVQSAPLANSLSHARLASTTTPALL